MADQSETPYLDAIVAYVEREPGRFHIPGHKGTGADPGLIEALGEAAVLHDVPAGIEGIDPELGIAPCITPETLDAALAAEPGAVAAMLVSPTYFGAVARIADLAEIAHARDVPLVVDEAWGSHLYFHDELPQGALRGGA